MQKLKKILNILFTLLFVAGMGAVIFLTTQKLEQKNSVAPTVPQITPKAAEPACTLTFALGPTPTPTATPTPTPTPGGSNNVPECTKLTANPNSGSSSPLTVEFTCTGRDSDGKILAAEFSFGDGNTKVVEKDVGSPGSISSTYTFTRGGTFGASCRVRDNNGTYSTTPDVCKVSIPIGTGPTPTPAPYCGTTCSTSTDCTSGMLCSNGVCRNPSCPTSTNCLCVTPTEAPVPKIPVSGTGAVLGASVVGSGLLLLLIGLVW
ncbi:PKD domain-containing protein [Candidatus Gottesmanbacteria bacterium]|nr:PKD domain-containing protein [Candidatus Gottesmanbacteria bacterium]